MISREFWGVHVCARLWPSHAAPCLSATLLPCSSKNTPGSRGSLCSGGSALGSAPGSSTSHRAFALASALRQPNLPARELGSSLRTPSCHEGRWMRAAPSPPGAAVGQHSTSGAAGRAGPVLVSMHQQVVGGRHEREGMGTCGERGRNGRDP